MAPWVTWAKGLGNYDFFGSECSATCRAGDKLRGKRKREGNTSKTGTQMGQIWQTGGIIAVPLSAHSCLDHSPFRASAYLLTPGDFPLWLGSGLLSLGGGNIKLVVTVNKSPSRGCRGLLISNGYKHPVSGAVRNASTYSECLSYVQLKQ